MHLCMPMYVRECMRACVRTRLCACERSRITYTKQYPPCGTVALARVYAITV